MQVILIVLGLVILICAFLDFFHTTLSGRGFGKISGFLNDSLSSLILKDKSKILFKYSGFVHVVMTTFMWLFLLLLGIYIIFLSGDNMVVNSETQIPATYLERFYYTSYLVSTLGNGDFIPGNNLSRIFSGILSFSGFILLTTAMTYLLSVVNAVLQKKQLAFYFSTMGSNMGEFYEFFTVEDNLDNLTKKSSDIKRMIIQNASSYAFFPIIQYFLTKNKRDSAELQLARLNEVLMVVQNNYPPESSNYKKVESIKISIKIYLDLGLEKRQEFAFDSELLREEREYWMKFNQTYKNDTAMDKNMNAAIRSAGWTWKDVYSLEGEQEM